MATRKIILPSPNSVSASATSLISCPVGPQYRYRAIHIKMGILGTAAAAVAATALPTGSGTTAGYGGDIRLKVNGKVQRLHTAAQLAKLNAINGTLYAVQSWGGSGTNTPGKKYGQTLTIWFAEPWRKSLGQQDAMAFPSSMVNTLEVEVDFGALPTNCASFNLSAWAEVDGETPDPIHKNGPIICKVFRQNLTGGTAANSALDIVTLDRRDLYQTIVAELGDTAMPGTAANGITASTAADYAAKLKITANGVDIHDVTKDIAAAIHQGNGLNPSQFDLEAVLDSSDNISSGLSGNGLSDLRVRIDVGADTAASASWILLTERSGPID